MHRVALLVVLLPALLTACGSKAPVYPQQALQNVTMEVVVEGLIFPASVNFAPDGRILILERGGLENGEIVQARLNRLDLPGVRFRVQDFEPWFSKYQGETCHGIQIHMTNRSAFQPIQTVLHFLSEVIRMHPSEFQFRDGFHRLAGNSWIQPELSKGTQPGEIQSRWQPGLRKFLELRKQFLLYPENGSNNK